MNDERKTDGRFADAPLLGFLMRWLSMPLRRQPCRKTPVPSEDQSSAMELLRACEQRLSEARKRWVGELESYPNLRRFVCTKAPTVDDLPSGWHLLECRRVGLVGSSYRVTMGRSVVMPNAPGERPGQEARELKP